ncbi:uncharacterized protein SOCEGT47_033530 [Sorangium cellulosum]|uniref:Uncharacterized protein n=1 Tax=Sorangium cellulosum TaxID=56 RepID=A0A4P2Q0T6_SORCE|nr:uncharacterized protein SOCEGT47_033530 [Sorangium cellulosum]
MHARVHIDMQQVRPDTQQVPVGSDPFSMRHAWSTSSRSRTGTPHLARAQQAALGEERLRQSTHGRRTSRSCAPESALARSSSWSRRTPAWPPGRRRASTSAWAAATSSRWSSVQRSSPRSPTRPTRRRRRSSRCYRRWRTATGRGLGEAVCRASNRGGRRARRRGPRAAEVVHERRESCAATAKGARDGAGAAQETHRACAGARGWRRRTPTGARRRVARAAQDGDQCSAGHQRGVRRRAPRPRRRPTGAAQGGAGACPGGPMGCAGGPAVNGERRRSRGRGPHRSDAEPGDHRQAQNRILGAPV